MVKRLSHVCLSTPDLRQTIQFYCGLLGCTVIHEFRNHEGELYGVFLLVKNGTFLEFFKTQERRQTGGAFRHLCFEVEDIHRCADRVREAGFAVEIQRGKTDRALQFCIDDPDGNRVEFHQYDPQAVQYKYAELLSRVMCS
ncbi:MAG: VOC family protein [Candidatus Omnitrophica bacterium]|nr:VOC family protein [Candidatus Omnitrophota bacterium]